MELHEPEIIEKEVDSQTTLWLAFCKKCLKECRPLYSKADAEAAFNERSCEGVREAASK